MPGLGQAAAPGMTCGYWASWARSQKYLVRGRLAQIALDDEVELADIGGQKGRAQHIIAIRLAGLGQQVLELGGEAHDQIAELDVLGIALLERRHDVTVLEPQQAPRESRAIALLVTPPHLVGNIRIEQAVHVE